MNPQNDYVVKKVERQTSFQLFGRRSVLYWAFTLVLCVNERNHSTTFPPAKDQVGNGTFINLWVSGVGSHPSDTVVKRNL